VLVLGIITFLVAGTLGLVLWIVHDLKR